MKRNMKFAFSSVILILFVVSFITAQNTAAKLELNKPLERTIKGGETHIFQFDVKAGFYARAEVEQKNIDVIVSLFAPDGKLVVEMDGKDGRLWREAVSCISEKDSAYRVEIKAYGSTDATGSYTVKLAEIHLSVPNDRKQLEAEAHLSAGRKFYEQSRMKFSEAVNEYQSAIALWRELNDEEWEAITLVNLGWTYFYLAKTDLSIAAHEQATELFKKTNDRIGESKSIKWLGVIYYNHLIQLPKAADYFKQTLIIQQEIKDREIGQTYEDLGLIYSKLRQPNIALFYYEKALIIHKEFNDQKKEGSTLHYLGIMYAQDRQYERAEDYYLQSLSIRRKIKDQRGEFYLYFDLGDLYALWRKYEKAITFYQYAVSMKRFATAQLVVANLYINLQTLYLKINNPQLSIIFGKQMVNVTQQMLSENYEPLVRIFGDIFDRGRDSLYRRLASTLVSEGRFPEAQAVLDLLKDEEYKQLTRSGETDENIPYNKSELDVIAKVENLAALGRRQSELQKEQKDLGDKFAKQPELDKVLADIEVANKAFRESLTALGKNEKSVENQVAEIQSEKNLQRALGQLSKELDTGAVAIYTVIGTEEETDAGGKVTADKTRSKFGWVILVTPEGRKAYPIDVKDLETTVFQFRAALSNDIYNPQPLAQKIYNAIFRQTSDKQKTTLEADLETYFAKYSGKTIMWSLDGVLRYIPMAALHDGKNYLVEKYHQTVFTKQSLLLLNDKDSANWQALGLGVSQGNETLNMSALPGAEKELKDIVKIPQSKTGIFDGLIRLNGDFKKDDVLRLWREGKYPVVHIASHFSFNSLDQTASFLLIGDGKLTFADIQDKDNLFGAVDLLTLSACDTAMSANGKESEGFAYLAQSLGAKSVIASLWKVSDAGTPELMIQFYKLRAENSNMSKGEAFRQAQLSMLGVNTVTNKSDGSRSDVFKLDGSEVKLPLFIKDDKKPFAHPHYWASFVLIGNWR